MLTATRLGPLRLSRSAPAGRRAFSSSTCRRSAPHPALVLDPSFEAVMQDINVSSNNRKALRSSHRELEVLNSKHEEIEGLPTGWLDMEQDPDAELTARKSPAALFGADQIGSVVLPDELLGAVTSIVADRNKSLLHLDAQRLFHNQSTDDSEGTWDSSFDVKYKSTQKANEHGLRDGTAFASVALPPHFAAISAVFHHAKVRLGPSFQVETLIDWGAATGSGLWAALYSFQGNNNMGVEQRDYTASGSTIRSYLGIDKRAGLVNIGKMLVEQIKPDNIRLRWHKSFKEQDRVLQDDGHNAVALSAFMLTALPNPLAQKMMVDEMWNSGAHTIILIDQDTEEGFRAIAHAREHLLELSRRDLEEPEMAVYEPTGAHVLAPCAHDKSCPLLHSGGTPLICGFSQRLQRPQLLQRIKRSGVNYEDARYSYVIIRRGQRPTRTTTAVGRVGDIGKRELEKVKVALPPRELRVEDGDQVVSELHEVALTAVEEDKLSDAELQSMLRKEAYQWPRLVFPPLKKSGHIILDACTQEGKIMRLTIPKSQGKQPYYDARKSNWGDIFPHPPKNAPQERHQPKHVKRGEQSSGDDIGKRRGLNKLRNQTTYTKLAEGLKEKKKLSKRDFAKIRGEKVWHDNNDE